MTWIPSMTSAARFENRPSPIDCSMPMRRSSCTSKILDVTCRKDCKLGTLKRSEVVDRLTISPVGYRHLVTTVFGEEVIPDWAGTTVLRSASAVKHLRSSFSASRTYD